MLRELLHWLCRHQWRSSCSLGRPDLQILGKVADKIWAVQQCLHAVAPDSELQAKLIGVGLAETDASARAEAQAASNPSITAEHQAQQDTEPDSQPGTESHRLHGQNSASSMEEQEHAKAQFAAGDGGKGSTEGSMECSSAAASQWRVLRLSLLRHKARLQTHMDIHHGYAPAEEVVSCVEDIGQSLTPSVQALSHVD